MHNGHTPDMQRTRNENVPDRTDVERSSNGRVPDKTDEQDILKN